MQSNVPTLYWFNRFDELLGILRVADKLTHTEELNGVDSLEFSSLDVPSKGDRILWKDGNTWREHAVVRTHESESGVCEVYAENTLCEMLCDFVEEAQLVKRTARQALESILATTRWSVSECADLGTASCLIYQKNALWALRRVAEVWGGDVEAVITVGGGRVSSRGIRLVARLGSWRGVRLTYGRNMAGCSRTVLDDDVYTALYGYGAGLPTTTEDGTLTGGFGRKLNFGDVNGGVRWVGDDAARELWGRWNAERTEKVHAFGEVTFPECEDAEKLLALTQAALADVCKPKVTYEVDVADLDGDDCALGDDVAVIDTSRTPEWRLKLRVIKRVRIFGERVFCARVTLGALEHGDYVQAVKLASDVSTLQSEAATTTQVTTVVNTAINNMDDLAGVEF